MAELKPGWKMVKFGDVVRLSKARSTDPLADGIERYVGLEHIEPGDLRIRSWGYVAGGTTFTSRFQPGQVLFGKRRAYQRKVAVADFQGVCSGDIYVLESANPEQLLPELLPFICQTDAFFAYAVGTSAGSLSPRTNWTSLADYEFALPPVEEQEPILAVLDAARDATQTKYELSRAASAVHVAALTQAFPENSQFVTLSEFCGETIARGIDQAGPHIPNGVPYIRVSDLTKGEVLSVEGMLRTSEKIAQRFSAATVKAGEIVVALRGVLGLPRIVPPELEGANLTQGTVRVSVKSAYSRDYIYYGLQSPAVKRAFRRYANGWKGESLREITLDAIRNLPFPWIEPISQQRVGEAIRSTATAEQSAQARYVEAQTLTRKLGELLLHGSL